MWAVLKIATFISTLIVGAHAANAASVHIIGDVTAGTGQLVISDDLYFTINGTNDPTHLIFSDWNTGFGQLASPADNWLDRVRASEFTDTTGGVLGISAQRHSLKPTIVLLEPAAGSAPTAIRAMP